MLDSLLDNDLYKFTMQQAVLEQFPTTVVKYRFNNRNKTKFNRAALQYILDGIQAMKHLELQTDDYDFIRNLGIFKPAYCEYLRNFQYNPDELTINLDSEGNLEIEINGLWHSTILWEVPLMALISEAYFVKVDTNWNYDGQEALAREKADHLSTTGLRWADFGTRRRRSSFAQRLVVEQMSKFDGFVGTSNVFLARVTGVRPIGTMAHEWIMGVSALRGLRHANHNSLYCWLKTYQADLGIALTDTFGTDSFFEDFDLRLAKTFDGLRHDSGSPTDFIDKVVAHYKKLKIDPSTKTIVFSDSLDVRTAQYLAGYCAQSNIRCSFGIGTHFTNDFKTARGEKSPALNMVIKLAECDGIPVVKLSDNPAKAIGDRDAIRVAKWTFFNEPLDQE